MFGRGKKKEKWMTNERKGCLSGEERVDRNRRETN